MQTFLPYPNFYESAKVLDRQRLGKQRVECLQILNTLLGESKGWKNHPAVKMWAGHELALFNYTAAICDRWIALGYQDTVYHKVLSLMDKHYPNHDRISSISFPLWWRDKFVHASHRSNLLRKNPIHYGQFNWEEPNNLEYIWPTPDWYKEPLQLQHQVEKWERNIIH